MKTETVYEQMGLIGLTGRVIRVKGNLVAQVAKESKWQRASTQQAAALFRNAFRLTLVKPGDTVVGWSAGESRFVLGTFAGSCPSFEVVVSRDEHVFTEHMLPVDVAVETGVWSFRKHMQVAAFVEGQWVVGTWQGYEEGRHSVRLRSGSFVSSEQAHTATFAVQHGLVH